MSSDIATWLNDILKCTFEIELFIKDTADLTSFVKDIKTRKAVERNIEIIAEAMSRIAKKDRSIMFENARKIRSTRNKIVHGYDYVSYEIIWQIAKQHIYPLREEVQSLIEQID